MFNLVGYHIHDLNPKTDGGLSVPSSKKRYKFRLAHDTEMCSELACEDGSEMKLWMDKLNKATLPIQGKGGEKERDLSCNYFVSQLCVCGGFSCDLILCKITSHLFRVFFFFDFGAINYTI